MNTHTPPNAYEQASQDESIHLAKAIGELTAGHDTKSVIVAMVTILSLALDQHDKQSPEMGPTTRRLVAAGLTIHPERALALITLAYRMLDPDDLGWAVSQEVRDKVQAALAA